MTLEDLLTSLSSKIRLALRRDPEEKTIVRVEEVEIGGDRIAVMAGPCSVEGRDQALQTARGVKEAGASILRGGAFKPRTSPYSFQGLGEEGLRILAEAREETGLPVVTEALSPMEVELVERYADMLQIGARNMQNYPLLKRAGKAKIPVLLKRGFSSTLEEWLSSAEYILREGNGEVVLCERGIRTFEPSTRFTLDLSIIPLLKGVTPLPIMVDPSHGTGRRELVEPMSRAAVAAGADGLMVEVHPSPDRALSDGPQSLDLEGFRNLMRGLRPFARAAGRGM